jgi:hypothetical protein
MSSVSYREYYFVRTAKLLALGGSLLSSLALSATLDENIATSYTALGTSINWQVAGVNPPTSSGTLGPFKRACAILEGKASTLGDVVSRSVYILDAGDAHPNTVVLHVYTRTDTFTTTGGVTSDLETINPLESVVLPLTSRDGAACYMAENDTSVFAGTNANNQASIINKKTFAQTAIQSYVTATGDNVSQITASESGVVLVSFGLGSNAGFAEFDDKSHYLAAGQFFNFTVVAGTTVATTF